MKTIPRHLQAISLVLLSVLTAPFVLAQPSENSSGAISVDRSVHYAQTGAGQVTFLQTPFNFTFHVRGGSPTLKTNWGPKFYKAGSGGVVQSGTSSATNTGTLNFLDAPNNGSDFMFVHEFDTDAAMQSFYPIAPTAGGQYGVKFLGSGAPAAEFTDGLVYAAGTTYPSAVPQVTAVDNGASWVGGKLRIKPTGLTTLDLQSFPEYSSTTYGSLIAVGIYDSATGAVVNGASATSWYLPMGDSTEDAAITFNQPAITELTLDGSWLIAGRTYTLEIQYAVIAGRPEEASLSGVEFQGVSSYRRVTTISVVAGSASGSDFNGDGHVDILWQNTQSGERYVWFMEGTTNTGGISLGGEGLAWSMVAAADFNGDGHPDILWQNTQTGERYIWFMNGTTHTGGISLGGEGLAWSMVAAADFNSDGHPDILWQNTETGERYIWLMNGTTHTGGVSLGGEGVAWSMAAAADFNGDGHPDILWQNTETGQRYIWFMNDTTHTGGVSLGVVGTTWFIASAADYNGDGHVDILWQNSESGERYIWFMNGTVNTGGISLGGVGTNWSIVN